MTHVIGHDGEVFISVSAMLGMLNQMVEQRDQLVAEDPGNKIFVPGSDAAVHIIGRMLQSIREEFVAQADLTDEAKETLEAVYKYLDEQ